MIVETQPSCTLNISLNETAEGDRIRLTCEVKYCGTNKATILWKDVKNTEGAVQIGWLRNFHPTRVESLHFNGWAELKDSASSKIFRKYCVVTLREFASHRFSIISDKDNDNKQMCAMLFSD